ncbi:uncharacterized protein CLUP02_03169 [Colletotrichum lupini]|uniref:Uncharacterized protein n=1 Tax=Colletotrichum lupini TaxID=145971 RepID=A0A9Q8SID2_9PEZI|nr:uncharacterized protein CLUP02_03169 [Colletotrichum lupini]UQC77698.1 hypothetical protein CLUP02_03169 [Colletotrichum lupini]
MSSNRYLMPLETVSLLKGPRLSSGFLGQHFRVEGEATRRGRGYLQSFRGFFYSRKTS